jgi:hypothetical protein
MNTHMTTNVTTARQENMATRMLVALLISLAAMSTNASAQSPVPAPADASLTRLIDWLGGEWDNNEQVWQQGVDAAAGKPQAKNAAHIHTIYSRVEAPLLGATVFYFQQSLGSDASRVTAQRVYRLTPGASAGSVMLEVFQLRDPSRFQNAHLTPALFKTLDERQLRAMPGCEMVLRYDEPQAAFAGKVAPEACSFASARDSNKRLSASSVIKLTEGELVRHEQVRDADGKLVVAEIANAADAADVPSKSRKVRYYTGWAYIHRDGPKADISDKKFSVQRNMQIHNEGQRIALVYDDGTPSPYMVELAQLTYPNTRTAILKLALIDKDTKKSVTYIWANTDATRIGMNLGWFQVGFTQKPSRVAYGFGDPPAASGNAEK